MERPAERPAVCEFVERRFMDFVKQRFGPRQNRRLVNVPIGVHRRPRLLGDPVGRFNEAENQGLSVDERGHHRDGYAGANR